MFGPHFIVLQVSSTSMKMKKKVIFIVSSFVCIYKKKKFCMAFSSFDFHEITLVRQIEPSTTFPSIEQTKIPKNLLLRKELSCENLNCIARLQLDVLKNQSRYLQQRKSYFKKNTNMVFRCFGQENSEMLGSNYYGPYKHSQKIL